MRIQINLSERNLLILDSIARHEFRDLRQQAAWIIEQELKKHKQRSELMNPLENGDSTSGPVTKKGNTTIQS